MAESTYCVSQLKPFLKNQVRLFANLLGEPKSLKRRRRVSPFVNQIFMLYFNIVHDKSKTGKTYTGTNVLKSFSNGKFRGIDLPSHFSSRP